MGGKVYPPNLPVYAGYTFREWGGDYTNVQSHQWIYAQYDKESEPIRTYTVKFWSEGKLLKTQKVPEGGNASAPVPEPPKGYYFTG